MKNNRIKDMLNNIEVSKELDDMILSKTINKKKNLILKQRMIMLSAIIIIITTGFGITYADVIAEKIKNVFVKERTLVELNGDEKISAIEFETSSKKELNYDANMKVVQYTDEEYYVSLEDLEKELNINLLKSELFQDKSIRIAQLKKIENKISSGLFFVDYVYKNKMEEISFTISFITKYHNEDKYTNLVGINRNDQDNNTNIEYYKFVEKNEHLNTDLYYFSSYDIESNEKGIGSITVKFVYDDIIYSLIGNVISKEKILDIINSLHY